MPMQTGQSGLLKKLGQRSAQILDQNKTKEPELPNMGLPAGIDNGVAEVRECKFGVVPEGKKNPGALFFMAQAIVKKPKEHNGVPVAGQRTMLYKEIATAAQYAQGEADPKKLAWAQDQLKMLAGRGTDPEMFTLARMEGTASLIKKARPHTLFRTWKGDKQDVRLLDTASATSYSVKPGWWLCNLTAEGSVKSPVEGKGPYASEEFARKANPYAGREPMVNHQWGGIIEYHEEAGPDAWAVSYNGQARSEGLPSAEETPAAEPSNEFEGQEGEGSGEGGESAGEEDLDALAAEAYLDVAAQKQLNDLAIEAGVSEEDVSGAERWEDVVAMIRSAQGTTEEEGSGEDEHEAEPEPWKPAKGEVCFYTPKLPNGKPQLGKNKKPLHIEVEVLTSDPKTSTCTVKDMATKKPLLGANKKPLGVSWDDLSEE